VALPLKAPTQKLEPAMDRLVQGRETGMWPEGPRDLWADALGVIFLLSLHNELNEPRFLSEAEWVAQEVDRVLGRRRGIRMGEGADAEGQSFRPLAIWIFALHRLGQVVPRYKARALDLVREIHAPFVRPGAGIISRMDETLSRPYPGSDAGRLDVFLGLAVYKELDAEALRPEIAELEGMVQETYRSLAPDNGADLGLILWIAHLSPDEAISLDLREKALSALDARWVDPPGYFRRGLSEPWNGPIRADRLAVTNFSAALGLQAQGVWTHRVERLLQYFREEYSWDEDGGDSLATVLNLVALYPGLLLRD
jgi:hypothetical protein